MHQAFGYAYQLPNVTAYNETCATIGSLLWASRMFAIHPQAQFMNHIERSCYNLVLAAVSLSGNKYFYENMLRRTQTLDYELMWPLQRESLFQCFCCPTNISRTLTQVAEYAYRLSETGVYTGVYGASTANIRLQNGAAFALQQETDYPWDGAISFTFPEVTIAEPFTLHIRIPDWVRSGSIQTGSRTIPLGPENGNTFVSLTLTPATDAAVHVLFDMPAFLTRAHTQLEADENHVCVQRGPLVYCAESADTDSQSLDDLLLYADAAFTPEPYDIGGVRVVSLCTTAARLHAEGNDPNALYQPLLKPRLTPEPLRLIPYFAWDNRGFGEMRIWFPVAYRA